MIGCGYWGPKLVRNFSGLLNCTVKIASDFKSGRLDNIHKEFPFIETTKDYMEILQDESIHAVAIATPVSTHKKIAEEALKHGKHVFVEKPMTNSVKDAKILVHTAKKLNRKLAVGHVFQFAPAVRKIKKLLENQAIGKILHITSTRINLGPPESEVDVIWDLGPHDFSIILDILNESPEQIECRKNAYAFGAFNQANAKRKLVNNAHINMNFKRGISADIHLSWLSSNKIRLMQIFGTEGTIVYDEMLALDGKLKLFGKGIDNRIKSNDTDSGDLGYNAGEIHVISLEQHEPLRLECQEFINSIINDSDNINNGQIGLEVVRLLEASSKS